MIGAAVALAVLAILLAWPLPVALSRTRWPQRAPATALVLWQGIALSGGLSMIGALLLIGLSPFGASVWTAIPALPAVLLTGPFPPGAGLLHTTALAGALLLAVHLLLNLGRTVAVSERQRRRHRTLVALLSEPLPRRPGARVLEHEAPIAYCLPGASTVMVLSDGLVRMLDESELEAVVEHERAHLLQQHHVVLIAFASWRSALPWFPIATKAQDAVGLLVEMLADDHARAKVGDAALASAIDKVGLAERDWNRPAASPKADLSARIGRLSGPHQPLSRVARTAVLATTVILVSIPWTLLLLPYR